MQSVTVTHTHRRRDRLSDVIWGVVIFLVGAAIILALTGCTSVNAQKTRWEFAYRSEDESKDNALAWRDLAKTHIDAQAQHEVNRLKSQLMRLNSEAGADVDEIAKNYLGYNAATNELQKKLEREYLVMYSLYEEQVALARGFRIISEMADREATIGQQAARDSAAAAIASAEAVWASYQASKAPLPSDSDDDEPDDDKPTDGVEQ